MNDGVVFAGVVKDALSSHAVYAVTVKKTCGAREIDNWIVYRRYSDFHDFHARMESRVSPYSPPSPVSYFFFNDFSLLLSV